jgi:hypothetical protein
MIGLLPRIWRRPLIDSVYGAEDEKGLRIYLGVLWAAAFAAVLILGRLHAVVLAGAARGGPRRDAGPGQLPNPPGRQ